MTTADVPSLPSWEAVLHAVEQDVLRTEAMLLLAVADLSNRAEAEVAAAARTVMSPSVPELPPLEMMPKVPPTMLERVQALRERITQVRGNLERAMSANRRMVSRTNVVRPVVHETRARFIDTVV